jgi:hypothetical protein
MSNYNRSFYALSEGNANGAVVGNYLLTRTRVSEGALQFHPLGGFVKVITAANIQTGATVNIGTNSPNFNNIVNGMTVNGPARTFSIPAAALAVLQQLPIDTDINIRVATAATPTAGQTVTLTFRAAIEGLEL